MNETRIIRAIYVFAQGVHQVLIDQYDDRKGGEWKRVTVLFFDTEQYAIDVAEQIRSLHEPRLLLWSRKGKIVPIDH